MVATAEPDPDGRMLAALRAAAGPAAVIAVTLDLHVKSRGHFRAGFDEWFAPGQVREVDTAGLTSPVLERFAWGGLPRPIYPLDPVARWKRRGRGARRRPILTSVCRRCGASGPWRRATP